MNPISSIPPTPPRNATSSPLTEKVLSSHDASNDVSSLSSEDRPRDDTVSLSTPTLEISSYLEGMSQIPDVRQARIAHIQQAIDSQTYAVSPEKLADSLIQELQPHPQETRPPTTS